MTEKPPNSLEALFENRRMLDAVIHAIADECSLNYVDAYERLREGAVRLGGGGSVRRALEMAGVSPVMVGARLTLLEQEAAEDARQHEAEKPKKARKRVKRELEAAQADMAAGIYPGSRDLNGAIVKYLDDNGLGREKYTEVAHGVLTGRIEL